MSQAVSATAQAAGIAVFAKGTRTNGTPSTRVSYEQASEWVLMGVARWVNRKRHSIILVVEMVRLKVRDISAQMGPALIFACAVGSQHHRNILAEWESARLPIAA